MKLSLSALSLLCTCIATADSRETWLSDALTEREATLLLFDTVRKNADDAILTLTDSIPEPEQVLTSTDMPESPTGETVAVADGGMLFDVEQGHLVYINNVRVVDARLRMRCSDRLYIHLPDSTLNKGEEEAKNVLKETPQSEEEGSTVTPPAETEERAFTPVEIDAATAIVDSVKHNALILGKTGKAVSISIIQGENRLILKSTDEKPARMLVDSNGDILINADSIDLHWQDNKGRISKLSNSGGLAYYRHSDSKLLITGTSQLETPEGNVRCTEEICLLIQQEQKSNTGDSDNLMPQFNGIRIAGINGASALGDVHLEMQAKGDRPALSMQGDSFAYNGRTGECSMSGDDATITYGDHTLSTNGTVSLAENGNISMVGDSLRGRYLRPADEQNPQPSKGEFFSHGNLQFIAETGEVHISDGIELKDEAMGTLTIKGPLHATLLRTPNATLPKREEMGMINPLILAYTEIKTVKTSGGIELHYTPRDKAQELHLSTNAADIDMQSGLMTFTAAENARTVLTYSRETEQEGEQATGKLVSDGTIIFKADKGILSMPQGVDMQDSQMGSFRSKGAAEICLAYPSGALKRKDNGLIDPASFAQAEVESFSATGEVALSYNSQADSTTVTLEADSADLDMRTGMMLLSADEPNHVLINYTRPGQTPQAAPLSGTFTTSGTVVFNAAEGTLDLPSGVNMVENGTGSLNIGGATKVQLSFPQNEAIPARSKCGLYTPAYLASAELETLQADGGIAMNYVNAAENKTCALYAETADIDLRNGSIILTTSSAGKTQVTYDDFSLVAESQLGETSLRLEPNGDITMLGETLTASLPTNDGTATLHCTEKLTLHRESAELKMGAGAIMQAPQGRFTANGPLTLTLAEGDAAKARPLLPQCPQLVYNFSGLKLAETEQGGTVQTKEAALRCSGRIHVEMADTPTTGKDKGALPVKTATAEGDVAVTGKDADGRILTAFGDKLIVDGTTGEKRLSGKKVILQDGNNMLTSSGAGAAVVVDKRNNVRVTGAKQTTSVSNLRKQIDKQQKNKK